MYYEDYLRPKRILMTADTMGGVWTYAVELARVLVGDGLEVGLATMGALLQQEQREEIGQLAGLSLFESSFKLEWMEDPWEDIARAGSWLLAIEDDFRPDVIHLNGYAHGCLPWKAPTLVVGHSCVISWWEAVHGEQAPAVWDRYYLEIARGLQPPTRWRHLPSPCSGSLTRITDPFSAGGSSTTAAIPGSFTRAKRNR